VPGAAPACAARVGVAAGSRLCSTVSSRRERTRARLALADEDESHNSWLTTPPTRARAPHPARDCEHGVARAPRLRRGRGARVPVRCCVSAAAREGGRLDHRTRHLLLRARGVQAGACSRACARASLRGGFNWAASTHHRGKKKCAHVSDASALHACCSRARVLARMSAGVLACSLAGLLACSRRLTPPAGSPFCSFASASAAAVAARVRPPLQRRVRVHQRARCVHLIAVAADVSALLRRALTKPAFSFPRPTSRRRQGAHRR